MSLTCEDFASKTEVEEESHGWMYLPHRDMERDNLGKQSKHITQRNTRLGLRAVVPECKRPSQVNLDSEVCQ